MRARSVVSGRLLIYNNSFGVLGRPRTQGVSNQRTNVAPLELAVAGSAEPQQLSVQSRQNIHDASSLW